MRFLMLIPAGLVLALLSIPEESIAHRRAKGG